MILVSSMLADNNLFYQIADSLTAYFHTTYVSVERAGALI